MRLNAYEYWENGDGKWNFRLRAKNGEIQFASTQGYNSERDCIRGIKAARRNSRFATIRNESRHD